MSKNLEKKNKAHNNKEINMTELILEQQKKINQIFTIYDEVFKGNTKKS
jgi:hypothetical protein